ncbi:hypothetical protein L916_14518, partial [Phytophthora nicotianae]
CGRRFGLRRSVSPALGPLPGTFSSLSPKQWKQWVQDVQELNVSSSVFLATSFLNESLSQAANEELG